MQYTQEDIDRKVSSIQASVDVIDSVINNEEGYAYFTEQKKADAVHKNYRHIEIILNEEQLVAHIKDANSCIDAIKKAKNYLGVE